MDDYENIFNGAGSAPTAAGGAASLGPDAAGYAPTAAATPTPRQTSPVDALAPQRAYSTEVLVPTDGRPIGPGDYIGDGTRANPFLKSSGDALVSRATDHPDAIGRQGVAPKAQEILGLYDWATKEMAKSDAMARLAESLRGGAQKGIEDFYWGREPGGSASDSMPIPEFRPVKMPTPEFRPVKMPTVDERQPRAPWDGLRRPTPTGNRYEYRGYQAELPSGVDLGDPAAVSRATAMNNMLIDWMFDNDEEEV